ncbi:MAG TPA: helix-turn-helix domain-containing protein [Thermoplasmata archaeon]|nr:helix-turn-helix domain-containing protein [Thermoplasmata archaeon]
MQAVTLRFRTDDLVRLGVVPPGLFEKFEEIELLQTLRLEEGSRLELLRVRRRGALRSAAELGRDARRIRALYGLSSFEVVDVRPRSREYVVLARQRNPERLRRWLALAGGGITPAAPFRVDAEETVASFHGEERAIRRVLRRLDQEEFPYRLVRTSGRLSVADRADGELTPLQGRMLARAWALGYYAIPRRVTLGRLARSTGRSGPGLGKLLRRAEGHLVARWLSSQGTPPDDPEPPVHRSGRTA